MTLFLTTNHWKERNEDSGTSGDMQKTHRLKLLIEPTTPAVLELPSVMVGILSTALETQIQ
jgi:hypothetical protein